MNEAGRQDILRTFILSLWAMLTLVLLFAVGLLVYEMARTGRDPLASLRIPEDIEIAAPADPRPEAHLGTRDISLYFASSDGRALTAETFALEYTGSTVENCRKALDALLAGPRDILVRTLPAAAKVRALYLLDTGELVVDFSRDLQTELGRYQSASAEALFVYSVVNTLTQPVLRTESDPAVRTIRFLIEGAPPAEAFPAHLDLSGPIAADASWVDARLDRPAHV